MGKSTVWLNSDGLRVGFGTRSVTSSGGQVHDVTGPIYELHVDITGTDCADTVSTTGDFITYGPVIPNGALITSAVFVVEVPFVGASGTMDIGTFDKDGGAVDANGIDAAIAVTAIDAVNDTITCDGADVGTIVATSGGVKIGASYNTTALSAGKGTLTVSYIPQ